MVFREKKDENRNKGRKVREIICQIVVSNYTIFICGR